VSEWKIWRITATGAKEAIVDGDINRVDGTAIISTCQMPGSTFIKNLMITINGREVFNANQLYSYKAYLDAELSYNKEVKKSYLSCLGYFPDSYDQDSNTGTGYTSRAKMFAGSRTAQFITNIDADLFAQDLYLINNCEVDIEITPQSNEFMLVKPATNARNYQLELQNIKLYVKMVDLMDGLSLDLARKLDVSPARYSMRKSMLKSDFISEGRLEYNANIFTNEVPRRVIVGFLVKDSFQGDVNTSPFSFRNFNIRDITIVANGRNYPQTVEFKFYSINFYIEI